MNRGQNALELWCGRTAGVLSWRTENNERTLMHSQILQSGPKQYYRDTSIESANAKETREITRGTEKKKNKTSKEEEDEKGGPVPVGFSFNNFSSSPWCRTRSLPVCVPYRPFKVREKNNDGRDRHASHSLFSISLFVAATFFSLQFVSKWNLQSTADETFFFFFTLYAFIVEQFVVESRLELTSLQFAFNTATITTKREKLEKKSGGNAWKGSGWQRVDSQHRVALSSSAFTGEAFAADSSN